jgi:hypothetical protein
LKNFLLIFSLFLFLNSCSKEKEISIAGSWQLEAIYRESEPGVFYWEQTPARFYYVITFSKNGTFSSFSDVPEGHGSYEYNSSTRKLTFWDSNSIAANITEVSLLNQKKMIIDSYYNGVVSMKSKYYKVNP